jgi:predicted nucleotidyltransferase
VGRQIVEPELVIAKLRQHESELRASGIARLSLFGSVARGDHGPESDVDLMAEFDVGKKFTLFSLSGVRLRISDILGVPVDLAERRMLKEGVKDRAEREAIVVF